MKLIENLKKNKNTSCLLLLSVFIFSLSVLNYIYCNIYTSEKYNFFLIDENGKYLLKRISFGFGMYLKEMINGDSISLAQFGIDLPTSRRPLLPYFIISIYEFITTNFILIHLVKNIFFGLIIFYTIKNFRTGYNGLFLGFSLIIIFYNPHNSFTNLGTENEEGILNYLIIIFFFVLMSSYKFKSLFISFVLLSIFFLKGSMFLLCFAIPVIFIFTEKKTNFRYLPLIIMIIANISWGYVAFKKTGFFAIGPKSSAMNSINLATVTHKYFNLTYPDVRPDIHLDLVESVVLKKGIKTESGLIDHLLPTSLKYIKENPWDYAVGVAKKIYILSLSPFKDTQYPKDPDKYRAKMYSGNYELNKDIDNPIRFSNFPNKIVFNLSLFFLFFSFLKYKKNNNYINKLNIYYFSILLFYLAPYMFAWIYPRHATSLYIVSHFYILIYFIETNKMKLKKIFIV